jgi:hypothetical protein
MQCRPGAIVYFWHFAVRKETEKIPRAESVVFYANTVFPYAKSALAMGLLPFHAAPKIFSKNRK